MFSDITQMDSCKPPAVCASVHYDTARKAWVPLVKLISDGKEISYPCGSKQRLCVMRGEDSVEIDGEEVPADEREDLALKYPQFDEHYDRIKDLKEVIAGYTTSFFVYDESEGDESYDSDDEEKREKEKEKEKRSRTPPSPPARVKKQARDERSEDEKEKDDKDEKDEKSEKDEKDEEKDEEKERERKPPTSAPKLRKLTSRRCK